MRVLTLKLLNLCKNNNLFVHTNNLQYGSLISNLKVDIPINKSINNISLNGSIGYSESLNPDIILSGNMPYWLDKRGVNFGNLNLILILIELNSLI